ncbi:MULTISPECIES: molybdopterin synthase sulfur carrier subunit [Oceanimonas]|uniref:Molybdopterin synthase sulfur carrier subunit n=1 Tax=Oceanimonas doudoroffii TaxID=84158 RepID=A0A233RHD7_9GAMM|nr:MULTISPECIES: molybdopterin synthase sulfur carrier subunit [Oceanimonas]NHI00596.1 Molybdopterin synthase sulfur carrier subunit [Oceanimonas sp. MB9]OXY82806.1 molybdopterin synthase sulfur carrier subunit [Oceanimonas doudoroffii]
MIKVVFFARVREQLGEDELSLNAEFTDVNALREHLAGRNDTWAQVLADNSLLVAVNHEVATPGTALKDGDEVAFFPPVTGG